MRLLLPPASGASFRASLSVIQYPHFAAIAVVIDSTSSGLFCLIMFFCFVSGLLILFLWRLLYFVLCDFEFWGLELLLFLLSVLLLFVNDRISLLPKLRSACMILLRLCCLLSMSMLSASGCVFMVVCVCVCVFRFVL